MADWEELRAQQWRRIEQDLEQLRPQYAQARRAIEQPAFREQMGLVLTHIAQVAAQYKPGRDPVEAVFCVAQIQVMLEQLTGPLAIVVEFGRKQQQLQALKE